jgi:hemoglobin-like flavoprotein
VEKTLGKAFTPELKDAWATAYIVLSTTMIDAAWPASLKARG